jgi:hypothetical protein
VNSIGYVTGSPASDDDVIHTVREVVDATILEIKSNVAYAGYLEKRFTIMTRGIDRAERRMNEVALTQIRNTLDL